MAVQIERHLFSLEEYEHMIEAGVFKEDARLELIRGEILEMTPIGFDHGFGVANLNRLLSRLVGDNALVWVQSPIRLRGSSRPEPDLVLLRPRPDLSPQSPPTASDVILLVEVADTSLNYDRSTKGPLYAEAGIPEYWIVNLREGVVEVFTDPAKGAYRQTTTAKQGDHLALPTEIGGTIEVSAILGPSG
jgi:Uma2 family endonuclease